MMFFLGMYGTVRSSRNLRDHTLELDDSIKTQKFGSLARVGKGFFFLFLGCLCIHALDDFRTYIGLCAISAGVFQFLLLCFAKELPYDQALLSEDDTSDVGAYQHPADSAAYQNLEDAMVDKVASKVVEKAEERVRNAARGDNVSQQVSYSDF